MSILSSNEGFSQNFVQTQPQALREKTAPNKPLDVEEFVKSFSPQDIQEQCEGKALDPMGIVSGDRAQLPTGRTLDPGRGVSDFLNEVNSMRKHGAAMAHEVMAGESDNLHQSMIAMQEAGVAFNLMVEVRNKLMDSYQELMRMSI